MDIFSLFRNTPLVSFLSLEDLLNSAITCNEAFTIFSAYINRQFIFRYPVELKWYKPHKFKVGGFAGASCKLKELHPISLDPLFAIDFNILPPNITHLTFGRNFNHPVDSILPLSLTNLTFGSSFNQSVDYLPPNILHLYIGRSFNQAITNLPQSLTYLRLGFLFQHPIENLPSSLITLKVDRKNYYSGSISLPKNLAKLRVRNLADIQDLPPSITSLSISNTTIAAFPPNIRRLEFNPTQSQLQNLPDSLEKLTLNKSSSLFMLQEVPPKLKVLKLRKYLLPPLHSNLSYLSLHGSIKDQLPQIIQQAPNLTTLDISHNNEYGILQSSNFSPRLVHLRYRGNFGDVVELASLHLSSLKVVKNYVSSVPVDMLFPPTLKSLTTSPFNETLLPPGLEELIVVRGRGLSSELPPTLKKLNLQIVGPLPPHLPDHLEELVLGARFNHPLPPLPLTLSKLIVGLIYSHPFPPFPPSLIQFHIGTKDEMFESVSAFTGELPAIPPSVTHLQLSLQLNATTFPVLPPRIKQLTFHTNSEANPPKLPPLPPTLSLLRVNGEESNGEFFQKYEYLFD